MLTLFKKINSCVNTHKELFEMYVNNYIVMIYYMTVNWNKLFKLNFLLIIIMRFLRHEFFSLRSCSWQEPIIQIIYII